MTLIIALCCQDGVLMASDSQATEETGHVRFPVQKVFRLTNAGVWGHSGFSQAGREIRQRIDDSIAQLEASPNIGQSLVSLVRPVLEAHQGNFLQNPVRQIRFENSVLACGMSGDKPWIIELDTYCRYSHYEELRGFHAVGSGAGFAQAAIAQLAHFQPRERPLEHGKLIAYRVVDGVIETMATTLGGPIQMWVVEKGREPKRLDEDELKSIEDDVGTWETLENEALSEHFRQKADPAEMPPETS